VEQRVLLDADPDALNDGSVMQRQLGPSRARAGAHLSGRVGSAGSWNQDPSRATRAPPALCALAKRARSRATSTTCARSSAEERWISNPLVAGSNPAGRANLQVREDKHKADRFPELCLVRHRDERERRRDGPGRIGTGRDAGRGKGVETGVHRTAPDGALAAVTSPRPSSAGLHPQATIRAMLRGQPT
jgi:hypothetical protein